MCFEPHLDTDFEIYGSSIGVCNIPYFIPLCLNRKFQNMFPYFGRSDGCNIPLAKMVDFVSLGALFGPGAPDPDLLHFQFNLDAGRTVY